MIPYSRIIKNYILQGGGILFTIYFQFHIINSLPVSEYGKFNVIWSSILIAAIVVVSGMDRLLIYKLSRTRKDLHYKYYGLSVVSIALIYVFLIIGLISYYQYSEFSIYIIVYASLILIFHSLIKINEGALIANEQVTKVNFVVTFARPILFVILLFAITGVNNGLLASDVLGVQALSLMIVFIVTYPHFISILKLRTYFKLRVLKVWYKTSLPFLLIGSSIVLNQNVDVMMVHHYLGEEAVAYYSFPSKIILYASVGLGLYATMISPVISSTNLEQNTLDKVNFVYICLAVASLIISTVFALFIVDEYFEKYHKSIELIYYFSLIIVVKAWFGPVETYLSMTGNSYYASKILAISSILNIALNYVFIQIIGISGAIFATVVTAIYWHYSMSNVLFSKLGVKTGVISLTMSFVKRCR